MKPFFIEIQNFWAWADKLGKKILGHLFFWFFAQNNTTTHFGTVSPLSMFTIIQPLFLQKN